MLSKYIQSVCVIILTLTPPPRCFLRCLSACLPADPAAAAAEGRSSHRREGRGSGRGRDDHHVRHRREAVLWEDSSCRMHPWLGHMGGGGRQLRREAVLIEGRGCRPAMPCTSDVPCLPGGVTHLSCHVCVSHAVVSSPPRPPPHQRRPRPATPESRQRRRGACGTTAM